MLGLKTVIVSITFSLLVANFSSAASIFLNVEGSIATSVPEGGGFVATPFTAQYLVNTDVFGTGFREDNPGFTTLNSFSGAIESIEFQIAGNPSFFFDNFNRNLVTFSMLNAFGADFLFIETTGVDASGNPFTFDIRLEYDLGFFGGNAFDFDSALNAAIPPSSAGQPLNGNLFTDFQDPDFGLDFTNSEGTVGNGIFMEARLSPVPEPSQFGFACTSILLLAARRKRIRGCPSGR